MIAVGQTTQLSSDQRHSAPTEPRDSSRGRAVLERHIILPDSHHFLNVRISRKLDQKFVSNAAIWVTK